MTLILANQQVH